MRKNRIKAVAAAILVLTALILYGLLHDISQLAVFQSPPFATAASGKACTAFFSHAHYAFMPHFTRIPCWRLLNNYLVDALWFSSFTLYMQLLLGKPLQYLFCIAMAVLSECSQLLFPQLGTFDPRDLLLYAVILTLLSVCEKNPE